MLRILSAADEDTQGKGFCPRSHSQWAAGLGLTRVAPKPCASPSPTLFLHLPSTLYRCLPRNIQAWGWELLSLFTSCCGGGVGGQDRRRPPLRLPRPVVVTAS